LATLQEITAELQAAVGDDSGLGRTIKFDFRDEGCIHVDGGRVSNDDLPADCTLDLSRHDFEELARGRLDPAMAMMRGRLKIHGDMTVAMKLGQMFARARR
jgi:putative sterol carrier protein